ncbi:MAG: DNA-binding response regulator [Planctomycetes bacterium RBG_13_63_9]|nr:MAG: DNA-binding response regulator [Planctomycetes bacterium RBG_13_63_9]
MSEEPTVFLVDDDDAVLQSLKALVKVVFSRVEAYDSAVEFLRVYDPNRPGCLVLDVAMPGMSGLELQQKLGANGMTPPVVFITGHANVPMAVEAMQAGAVSFLEKPFREQDLWDSIRMALRQDKQNRQLRLRRQRAEELIARLTPREREVFDMIVQGKSSKEIAKIFGLSVRTIEDRRGGIMKKMVAKSVADLVHLAMMR